MFYMLCLGFICMLFGLHAYSVKRNASYRQLTSHEKIDTCFQHMYITTRMLNFVFSSHHILKHFAIVHPRPYLLLWIIPETIGFSTILSFSMIHPYLGIIIGCTYPLHWLEAFVVLWSISMQKRTHK